MKSNYLNESGRSMLELISVLAIIGVLTISAIALYQYGMDETIAQNTYEEIQKRAATSLERFKDRRYKFDSRPVANETAYGYGITVSEHDTNREYIVVTVDGVSKNVCEHLIRKAKKTTTKLLSPTGITVNTRSYRFNELNETICSQDDLNMQFVFHRSRKTDRVSSDVLNTCEFDEDCLNRVGDHSACLRCDRSTRLCVLKNNCPEGYACYQPSGTAYPKCHKMADTTSDMPCGLGECWKVMDDMCIPDDSLCFNDDDICGSDGFCTTKEGE